MMGILRWLIKSEWIHIPHLSKPENEPQNPGTAIDRDAAFRLKRRVSPNH